MTLFSERYGYTQPSDVIIREQLTIPIQNAICSCYDSLNRNLRDSDIYRNQYAFANMLLHLWKYFFNKRDADFDYNKTGAENIATSYINNARVKWYHKLDLIELTILYLKNLDSDFDPSRYVITNAFIESLNTEFERLNFAYRVVDFKIVEITSEEEIKSIESAISGPDEQIKEHLTKALDHYAKRPEGDYRNSIKESISAVEAYCRERTGKNTLGDAIKALKNTGITLHPLLETSLTKLYAYTNQPDTGIRHSLMDDSEGYTPGADEALFMLVTCSAFINYLRKK